MPSVSKSVYRKLRFASPYFAVSFSPEIMPLHSKTAVNSINTVDNCDVQNYCKSHSAAPPGEHLYENGNNNFCKAMIRMCCVLLNHPCQK